jgi:uncharacterized protein YciI
MRFKTYKAELPAHIDREWLQKIQEEGRRELEAKRELRRQNGEDLDKTLRDQYRLLLNGPKIDIDLDDLLRRHDRGEFDVPGRHERD